MSSRSGKKVSRRMIETYKGFDIVKVCVEYYFKSSYSNFYYTNLVEKREVYYEFCKEGEYNRPSQAYNASASSIAAIRERIDAFIKNDCLYFTNEEKEKYVYGPNKKNGWGFSYDDLIRLMKRHKKVARRYQILIEDRLVDANFHSFAGLLSECKYQEYKELAAKEYSIKYVLEITRIPNPESIIDDLELLVNDYIKRTIGVEANSKIKLMNK